jgi:hypothetical protein
VLATIHTRIVWPHKNYQKNIKIVLYRNIILAVALFGYEISCLRLREEHLSVLENVVQRIFGPER